ncbi:hypothetical protein [Nocardiopsis synnemataformans]|uniref:hypothetical protein n=1 Tax=Nocardiopsis synnemataformans TaxID=61305 RepID=UPI003EBE69BF
MSNFGLICGVPWPHDRHRYNDDGVYRNCPGVRWEPPAPAAPAVCQSRCCPRPGVNSAGFCCHGCAAAFRFGRPLLHGDRCEETNPGVEETADPLHAAIAAALYVAPDASSAMAERLRWVEAERRADKVMGVIRAEQERQSAALARSVEIDTYEQSHYDVTAALELAAEDRTPITVTTCNNSVTSYLPVPLNTKEQP